MLLMAKPKKTPIEEPIAEEPPKRGRPPGKRDVVAFQLRLPREMHKRLIAALAKTRRLKNTEIEMAVDAWLTTLGFGPAQDS